MAVFAYKAVDASGSAVNGTIVADTARQARDLLRDQGLSIRAVRARQQRAVRSWRDIWRRLLARREQRHVVTFCQELATMLGVGTALTEALDIVSRQHHGIFREVILQLREDVSAGAGLAESMRKHDQYFDEMCINLVEVGENAGTLDMTLERFASFRGRWQVIQGRIATALIYPLIVVVIGIGVAIFLMTHVVPNLLSALIESGRDLPWATLVVKGASDLLLEWWWLLIGLSLLIVMAMRSFLHTEQGRRRWHQMLLQLPLLGDLIRKQAIVRIAVVMSTLLQSGVVFVKALQIARRGVDNVILADALERSEQAVHAGQDLGPAMAASDTFSPLVTQVFSIGQESGKLEIMLDRLAETYDRQVQASAARLTTLIEPILIVLLALFVGFIAAATFFPILEAGNVL